jgi:3-methyl-2-oxobutanoate hydroxymethyltransferase
MKHTMITCYDATFAKIIADSNAIDSVLVGDSLGMVIQGHNSTLPVTTQDMIYHISAVAMGLAQSTSAKKPLLIGDMPANSYSTVTYAKRNAALMLNAGAQMVKVEGPVVEIVRALRDEGISVCGHIGLTPQSIHDFKLQGATSAESDRLWQEAKDLEAAGVELLVLEMIPAHLAKKITESIKIPTIGIGAGAHCSGQVLVLYDLLGLNAEFNPKFLKKFLDGYSLIRQAICEYSEEVRSGSYPSEQHSFKGTTGKSNSALPLQQP